MYSEEGNGVGTVGPETTTFDSPRGVSEGPHFGFTEIASPANNNNNNNNNKEQKLLKGRKWMNKWRKYWTKCFKGTIAKIGKFNFCSFIYKVTILLHSEIQHIFA